MMHFTSRDFTCKNWKKGVNFASIRCIYDTIGIYLPRDMESLSGI